MKTLKRNEKIYKISKNSWISVTLDKCLESSKGNLIICHGLTGDKIGSQRLLSDLSCFLSLNCQIDVIRFDFRGSGLSSGAFKDTTLNSMLHDALWVSDLYNKPLVWMGISTGSIIALMAAAARKKQEKVIAISNGFAESITFSNINNKELISIRDGQLFISNKFFRERLELYPRKNLFPKIGTLNIILGSKDYKHYKEYNSLIKLGVHVNVIKNADHLFSEPESRKTLFNYLQGLNYE